MSKTVSSRALTFDDVLIKPAFSGIASRSNIDISTSLQNLKMSLPIFSAPMDSVTEWELASKMILDGGGALIHRYNSPEKQSEQVKKTLYSARDVFDCNSQFIFGITVGVKSLSDNQKRIAFSLLEIENALGKIAYNECLNKFIVCIDVAHGDHINVHNATKEIKKEFPNLTLCAGNICTKAAALRYEDAGVNIIKCGIGPGATCSTRSTTGCGYPQLSTIIEIASATSLPIIADGGIKNSGDIVKALAAGADAVMIGSLFSSCPESCAQQIQDEKGHKFKIYRGMASYSAKADNKIKDTYVEGESIIKPMSEELDKVIKRLEAGIRSGFSYVGAKNVEELRSKAEFVEVSNGTQLENSIRS